MSKKLSFNKGGVMNMYFCNIISRTRIYQFIALYNSIKTNAKEFKIFVLCMDEDTFRILEAAKLDNIMLTKLCDIETEQLRELRGTRNIEEYCWTLKPVFLAYTFKNNRGIDRLTYLDADLFFYDDPARILESSNNSSVMLSEHGCYPEIKYVEEDVGRFNAGIISFKNNFMGRNCLYWWRKQCVNWCYNTTETGQFGDQKYLDQMFNRFISVSIIEVPGVNIAPWNDEKYKITIKKGIHYIDNDRLILYHYCGFRINDKNSCVFMYGNKYFPIIHNPYMDAIRNAIEFIDTIDSSFDGSFIEENNVGRFKVFSLVFS